LNIQLQERGGDEVAFLSQTSNPNAAERQRPTATGDEEFENKFVRAFGYHDPRCDEKGKGEREGWKGSSLLLQMELPMTGPTNSQYFRELHL